MRQMQIFWDSEAFPGMGKAFNLGKKVVSSNGSQEEPLVMRGRTSKGFLTYYEPISPKLISITPIETFMWSLILRGRMERVRAIAISTIPNYWSILIYGFEWCQWRRWQGKGYALFYSMKCAALLPNRLQGCALKHTHGWTNGRIKWSTCSGTVAFLKGCAPFIMRNAR